MDVQTLHSKHQFKTSLIYPGSSIPGLSSKTVIAQFPVPVHKREEAIRVGGNQRGSWEGCYFSASTENGAVNTFL